MKKLIFAVFIALLAMTSCGEKELTPEEKVRGFAEYFVEKASLDQIDSLQAFYPDIVKANGLVPLFGDSISVKQTTPNNFEVTIDRKVSMKVVVDANGRYGITETRGLFVVPDEDLLLAQRKGVWHSEITDAELAVKLAALLEERRNFTSPDLEFLNLRGPVKTVDFTAGNGEVLFDRAWMWNGLYAFDEDGKWTNPRAILPFDWVAKRNKEGRINYVGEAIQEDLYTYISYTWKDNQVVSFEYHSDETIQYQIFYSNGYISRAEMRGYVNDTEFKANIKISDISTDQFGNWISCVYKIDGFRKDYGIDNDFRKVNSDSVVITRNIVYY